MDKVEKRIEDEIDNDAHTQYMLELKRKYELCSGNRCHITYFTLCPDCNELIDDCTCKNKTLTNRK